MTALNERIEEHLGEAVAAAERTTGGSINAAWKLTLVSGREIFVKSRAGAPAAEFAAEAAGLDWLREAGSIRVPEVLGLGDDPPWLALEWIEPGILSSFGRGKLGRALAEMHQLNAPAFGSLPPGLEETPPLWRIGPLGLPGIETESWPELYAEHRLRPLLAMARERETLGERDGAAIERVCDRIEDFAGPTEPPARTHGDLWSGNVHADRDGAAWLIDPAACGAHREIDLAMLLLFGRPGTDLFDEYNEVHPLAEGHEERVELWQLLPLLVHAVLFGGGYGGEAGAAARRYG